MQMINKAGHRINITDFYNDGYVEVWDTVACCRYIERGSVIFALYSQITQK